MSDGNSDEYDRRDRHGDQNLQAAKGAAKLKAARELQAILAAPRITSVLGTFRCAEDHPEVLHGEGPFGCPVCAARKSVVVYEDEVETLKAQIRDLEDDLSTAREEPREYEDEAEARRAQVPVPPKG